MMSFLLSTNLTVSNLGIATSMLQAGQVKMVYFWAPFVISWVARFGNSNEVYLIYQNMKSALYPILNL